jgi:hypothetical protein
MTVSTTYGSMQSTIAFEIGSRTDLTAQIKFAIQTAIAKWERVRFYFNEVNDVNGFNTAAGQEFYSSADYALIGSMVHIDKVHALVSNNRYTLTPRTWQYIEDYAVSSSSLSPPTGISDYAYYAQQLRFYPIPDGVYPITLSGTKRFANLSADSDTNPWTQDAEALIRCEAKLDLYANNLRDDANAKRMEFMIYGDPSKPDTVGYLSALQGETFKRQAVPSVRATYF